jgi:hypothetical protein
MESPPDLVLVCGQSARRWRHYRYRCHRDRGAAGGTWFSRGWVKPRKSAEHGQKMKPSAIEQSNRQLGEAWNSLESRSESFDRDGLTFANAKQPWFFMNLCVLNRPASYDSDLESRARGPSIISVPARIRGFWRRAKTGLVATPKTLCHRWPRIQTRPDGHDSGTSEPSGSTLSTSAASTHR